MPAALCGLVHAQLRFFDGSTGERYCADEWKLETALCAMAQVEQIGCRDGMQMAALEFFWKHRQEVRSAKS